MVCTMFMDDNFLICGAHKEGVECLITVLNTYGEAGGVVVSEQKMEVLWVAEG
eukprot:c56246_g1_i1 orf=2-157(-)